MGEESQGIGTMSVAVVKSKPNMTVALVGSGSDPSKVRKQKVLDEDTYTAVSVLKLSLLWHFVIK